ncbi:aldo/keto reductase [Saccharopolyspora griseoalba]|uniref:Aldo/keto reductase n=1 Tax=Saccharopolyspora griseoalba TaxID=1431848 RepID=A0ABW2LCH8_9PSEU
MSSPLTRRPLGGTGLEVTPLCAGAAPLGSMPQEFGYETPVERGIATVRAAFDSGINFLDTANIYGAGESERRIGAALSEIGGAPEGFVLATKVDRDADSGDFSGDRMRRSAEESLQRLGVDRVPLLHLHDPEHISLAEAMAPGGPVEALLRLRDEGVAEHVGLAGGPVGMMAELLREAPFEVLVTHNRWTLLDRSADGLIDEAVDRGVAVLNAAVFGGGLLAREPGASTRYAYREADAEVLDAARRMHDACERYGVRLPAAALQFSVRDPRITSTVVGTSRPERIAETIRLAEQHVPEELWAELLALAAPPERWQW